MTERPLAQVKHRTLMTASLMLTVVLQTLDMTIANVALPHMQGTMSATQDQISWVLTSYAVAMAIMTPPTAFLAARFGRRRYIIFTVLGFIIASMACGASMNLTEIVIFRVIQGMCGAALMPLTQAIMLDTYTLEERGQMMAVFGLGVMVGPIIGPTLGSYLTDVLSWRWVFYINVPIGIISVLGMLAYLPSTAGNQKLKFDTFGFFLLSAGIAALQMVLDRGETKDWFSSPEIVTEFVVCCVAFYMFIVHMITAKEPFIHPKLFADRNVVIGLLLIFLLGVNMLASMALLPPFLSNLKGYPVIDVGIVLAPRGLGTMMSMLVVGRLLARVDARLLILVGILCLAVSLQVTSEFNLDVEMWPIMWTGMLQGFGLGFIFVTLSTITFETVAPNLRTEATSMFALARNVGSSIGVAIVMAFLTNSIQINHAVLSEHISPYNPALRFGNVAGFWSLTDPRGIAALEGEVMKQASTIAFLNDFRLMTYLTLLTIPMLLFLRRSKIQRGRGPRPGPAPRPANHRLQDTTID
jgi:MFS transporter, DHA2 family, multidrug resistance protein